MNASFFIMLSILSVPLDAAKVDYGAEVLAIFANSCFKCHGPDRKARKAGLRLDTFQGAVARRESGQAVVAGDPESSLVMDRITSSDPDRRMPPAGSGPTLNRKQIGRLRRWIAQGASYPAHWAFQPVVRRDPPPVQAGDWVRNPVDRFILARLEAEQIRPSPPGDHYTLIRRVYLDLLGMVPSPEAVDRFVADTAPDAYEQMLERVLANPHHGERFGRHWLDQARYADSNGYTVDSERSIWPYRDWVVGALNRDLPFDQFTIQQLAGDLMDDPTTARLVATGFHRNTLINEEGGSDREQFRVENVMDRVNTTGSVWLGLTIECAQCHHHKFDPISQRDYYELFAFFNNSQDANGKAPVIAVATTAQQRQLDDHDRKISAVRQALARLDRHMHVRLSQARWTVFEPETIISSAGVVFEQLADGSILAGGKNADADAYKITFTAPLEQIGAVRLEVLPHPSLPANGPGRAENGNFVLNEVVLADQQGKRQRWIYAGADHAQEDYPVGAAIDSNAETGWAINVAEGDLNVQRTAMFVLARPAGSNGRVLTLTLQFGSKPPKYNIGRFRLSVAEGLHNQPMPEPKRADLLEAIKNEQHRRAELNKTIATTMVMGEREELRLSHVLIRGDFLRRGDPVDPDVPAVLPPLPESARPRTRLDLARWLVDRQNPLTARVTVNRLWMRYFGRGLVETENDFGTQGSLPTHPQLLDWLAAELMGHGWSLKGLHRTIFGSATYRQASRARPDCDQIDPQNKLLWRQQRLRVEAEVVRDLALTASGLLDSRIGGPPVRPPQPDGVYAFTQRQANWPTSHGPDRYRRGMYTLFMRSAPYPMFTTFDSPRFNKTCTRRGRSNTPLQSLTMANDQTTVEIARGFAALLLARSDLNDHQRLELAFRRSFARPPQPFESERLMAYLQQQRIGFAVSPKDAGALVGEPGNSGLPVEVEVAEGAAWICVVRLLMNLDEFITRE